MLDKTTKQTKMKKTIISLASCALPACMLSAFIPQDLSISSDITYTSEYVFRGLELADESFQPTVELAYGDFYAGIWANQAFASDPGYTEINYYGGLSFDVPGADFVTFDAGLTVYHYPDTSSNRTHELYLGALFDLPTLPALTASLYYFYDLDLGSHVGEGAVTYSQSLEQVGAPVTLDFTVFGGVQGSDSDESESYNYYGASIELPMAVTEFSALTVGVHYATAEKFGGDARGKNLFWSLGYSTSF
jgi:uncharacterized protein (TIGR02001 family)